MQETAAAQALLVIESIRRVTVKSIINSVLHCLTTGKGAIEMIEEKTELTNVLDFRNVTRLRDPDAHWRHVYFLYCGGHVKIGVTNRVTRRISELQTGSPWASQVILLIPGGRMTENFLHSSFRDYCVGGEWFIMSKPVRDAIAAFAPPECQEWLAKEEDLHREWIRQEAISLGLIKDDQS